MHVGIPQAIVLALMVACLTMNCVKHGEPRGAYCWWSSVIALPILFGLYWWGGFFS